MPIVCYTVCVLLPSRLSCYSENLYKSPCVQQGSYGYLQARLTLPLSSHRYEYCMSMWFSFCGQSSLAWCSTEVTIDWHIRNRHFVCKRDLSIGHVEDLKIWLCWRCFIARHGEQPLNWVLEQTSLVSGCDERDVWIPNRCHSLGVTYSVFIILLHWDTFFTLALLATTKLLWPRCFSEDLPWRHYSCRSTWLLLLFAQEKPPMRHHVMRLGIVFMAGFAYE